ncbi:hypothetical protein FHS39_000220 [Streptomyces olivoverticillatus]|uniref:Uncharacterized protein n=1 Tax=Streptomyces olivoverticillatus TaxID=66427 RepID=A0A7W7LJ66_9ACTN|nr:hypothetical protein [Streptomyces olivoverticillatus]MBB4891220.1 hypothetical protein [Streptomyces olivoverticillatus]
MCCDGNNPVVRRVPFLDGRVASPYVLCRIFTRLKNLADGRATVFITHRPANTRLAQTGIFFELYNLQEDRQSETGPACACRRSGPGREVDGLHLPGALLGSDG